MKIPTKIVRCLILCTTLLSSSCSKQELPQPTNTGANTFSCNLNGRFWVPTGGGPFGNPTSGGFFRDTNGPIDIFIQAYADHNYFHIFLRNTSTQGTYLLNQTTVAMPYNIYPESYGAYFANSQSDYYITDATHTGTVKITYADTIQGIIAGTFEMKLYRKGTNEVLNITGGRFDYKTH